MKMREKVMRIALVAIMLAAMVPAMAQRKAPAVQKTGEKSFEIAKNLEIFADIYKTIHYNYVDDVDPGKTMKVAIDAMLASLDPYTNYFPESSMEDVRLQMLGEYGGIGAMIHSDGKSAFISEVYEGMPAHTSDLRAGDKILSVNGESAEGKSTGEISSALRGQAGTDVTVVVERRGKTLTKTLTRREIKLKPVPYYGFVGNGDYGYIKLNEFTQGSGQAVRDALMDLRKRNKNMKGLILDLRGNGGGLMNEAVDIVNNFVKRGELVVETKGKIASKNMKSYTRMEPVDTELPLVVLIDNYSASASEIVSGSLQDFDRAVVVGERSFGKGLVQNILPLIYNSQLKVTVSKYYIPSGRCIQAIDYGKRDEQGKAVKVPDSLKTAFLTRNGRTVYDGFGIEPDVEMQPEYMSPIAEALITKNLVFEYVNAFVEKHDSIEPADKFEIDNSLYADFCAFIAQKGLDYSTYSEKAIEELRRVAKDEKYSASLEAQIVEMEKRIKSEKESDLQRHRDEIAEMLKSEILTRYYYERGRIEGLLTTDPDVKKAIEVLGNQTEYKRILNTGSQMGGWNKLGKF